MAGAAAVSAEGELSLAGRGLDAVPEELAARAGGLVRTLDLTGNAVRSLGALRHLAKLEELVLDRNGLGEAALAGCPRLPSVETLWLNNNAIESLEDAMDAVAEAFPGLTYLSMLKNPACPDLYFSAGEAEAYQRYRLYVLHRLPGLELLDSTPVSEEELAEARRVGRFMRVARPDRGASASAPAAPRAAASEAPRAAEPEAPLPKPAAFLAKGRLRYDGTHSEGNRFIGNGDL